MVRRLCMLRELHLAFVAKSTKKVDSQTRRYRLVLAPFVALFGRLASCLARVQLSAEPVYHRHTPYVLQIVFCVDSFFRILGYVRIRFGYVSAAQKWDIQKKQPARYTNCFLRPSPRSSTPMVVLLRGAGLKKQSMVSTRDPLRGGCCARTNTPQGGQSFLPPSFSFLSSLLSLPSSPLSLSLSLASAQAFFKKLDVHKKQ